MIESKFQLNLVEFYITNVCNLTCENCNRFNNYKFTGWQDWNDYKDVYSQWAKLIEIKNIVILGGEPLLNPSINNWITGLANTFRANIQVLTNGLRLGKVRGMYDSLLLASNADGVPAQVEISLHNINHFAEIKDNIKQFLPTIVEESGSAIQRFQPNDGDYYTARDNNGVAVRVFVNNRFETAAVQRNHHGKFVLHDSDPQKAHEQCSFAQYKCHHFIRGSLYKCGPVALFPEFDQQFQFDISSADRDLVNGYQALTVDNWADIHESWIKQLTEPIPQCKFCPVDSKRTVIYPVIKSSVDKGDPV